MFRIRKPEEMNGKVAQTHSQNSNNSQSQNQFQGQSQVHSQNQLKSKNRKRAIVVLPRRPPQVSSSQEPKQNDKKTLKKNLKPSATLFKFIKKETLDQINQPNEKFGSVVFPSTAILYRHGQSAPQSVRPFTKGEKLTYIKFHDTLRPSLHTFHEKIRARQSIKRFSTVCDYDEPSEIYFDSESQGESINYADSSEEVSESFSSCSLLLDEDEDENNVVRPRSGKFRLVLSNEHVQFKKDPAQFGFL